MVISSVVADQETTRRRWWALVVLILPVLIISMDATVLSFAVPKLSKALEPSSAQLLWMIDIYSFVLAGLLVTMGSLGDRIGRRRLLMFGAAGFSVASVVAAFSSSAVMFIAARALLGLAGATLMPSTLSLIRNIFTDDRERQTAIAMWATAFGAGTAIGPIAAGFLLNHFWWGSAFLIGVPVTAALLVLAPRLIPESKDPEPHPFDIASAALSLVTVLPVVYAMKSFAENGMSTTVVITFVVGVAFGLAFTRRQRRIASPMIDLSLFRLPRFRMAVSGNLVACFGFAGSLFVITQYLQLVLGMSPMRAGIQLLPAVISSTGFVALAPTAARRVGSFRVVAGGLLCGAVGFGLMTQMTVSTSAWLATIAIVLIFGGLSMAMTIAIDGILAAIPPERAGAGASVSETANEFGVALGTAVLGSIVTAIYRSRLHDVADVPAAALHQARETLGAAVAAADGLTDPGRSTLLRVANHGFLDGSNVSSFVALVLVIAVSVWALATSRSPLPATA